ncbi:Uncharacterized protein APZ42_027553 [Daphnia magna]|uniref:Uncharacterized protein n=1 Tax=Daphnia magna TaxID=35525 RepID=A0A162D8Q2_9CRUS|nr:Uncharacterized protein APZ42_027553 [Daphnia magna]
MKNHWWGGVGCINKLIYFVCVCVLKHGKIRGFLRPSSCRSQSVCHMRSGGYQPSHRCDMEVNVMW